MKNLHTPTFLSKEVAKEKGLRRHTLMSHFPGGQCSHSGWNEVLLPRTGTMHWVCSFLLQSPSSPDPYSWNNFPEEPPEHESGLNSWAESSNTRKLWRDLLVHRYFSRMAIIPKNVLWDLHKFGYNCQKCNK